jgi:hypothetical protein
MPGACWPKWLFCVDPRPCGSTLRCVAPHPRGSTPRCDASRPCGSTLAGVWHRPLAIGHGCPVGLRAGVPDRRPVSPLSSSPACSGAGSGWHCRAWIADCTVHLGGPATVGAGPLMCADSWAVTLWRIASAARLPAAAPVLGTPGRARPPKSLSVAPLWLLSGPSWHPVRAGPSGPGRARQRPSQELARGPHHLSGQWPARHSPRPRQSSQRPQVVPWRIHLN